MRLRTLAALVRSGRLPVLLGVSRALRTYYRVPFLATGVSSGLLRLLEVGCGSGVHIRHAATRNAALTALGLELVPDVAEVARANVARWNLDGRVAIEVGDVRARAPEAVFDLATLHNNVNYFPVDERVDVLRYVRDFLRPGGRLLVTIACLGRGGAVDVLNLWGAMTAGCGRLPAPDELARQIEQAGFSSVVRRSLIPGESFFSFTATPRD
jgi:SAM-dependent methyltransferase